VDVRPQLRRLAAGLAALAAAALIAAGPALGDNGKGSNGGHGNTPAPPPAAPQGHAATLTVLGVVQSASGSGVSVRRLDGSSVVVPVDRNTKVTVDGKPARLTDVRPGMVLSATWQAGKAATTLRFVRSS
jgi:hypothetical protein